MTGHHNIFLGKNAGNDLSPDASYKFEFKSDDLILRKDMTEDEQKSLSEFIRSCDNNFGIKETHLVTNQEY